MSVRRFRSAGIAGMIGAALALAAVPFVGLAAEEPQVPAAARDAIGVGAGYRLPEFSATDLSGAPQSLSRYKGSILVLHFWASWCPYCRQEMPKLTQLATEFAAQGVRVLAISSDEDSEKLTAFVAQHQLPYPVVADLKSAAPVFDQYGISGIPVTFVVAKDGHAAFRLNGSSDIVGAVQALLP